MSARAIFAVAITIFTLPAATAQSPRSMPTPAAPGADAVEPSVSFETRIITVPAGFCERVGLKTADATFLSEAQLRKLLEAAQEHREARIVQLPKVTVADGQPAHVRNCETSNFVTSIEATVVNGSTVFIPKNKPIELGDRLALTGTVSADGRFVRVEGGLTRVRLEGAVELVPVTTQITPVFEGGSRGKPIPFTQFLQVPDVRTEKAEKTAVVPAGGTLVLGGWKETEPVAAPAKGLFAREKKEKVTQYEVVVLVTARALRAEPAPR